MGSSWWTVNLSGRVRPCSKQTVNKARIVRMIEKTWFEALDWMTEM